MTVLHWLVLAALVLVAVAGAGDPQATENDDDWTPPRT